MCKFAFVSACLFCISHGSRIQTNERSPIIEDGSRVHSIESDGAHEDHLASDVAVGMDQQQPTSEAVDSKPSALSRLLFALNPAVRWRVPSGSAVATSENTQPVLREAVGVSMHASQSTLSSPALALDQTRLAQSLQDSKHGASASAQDQARATSAPMMGVAASLKKDAGVYAAVVMKTIMRPWCMALIVTCLFSMLVYILNRPSRVYNRESNTVGNEYDAWTSEGILEHYWGEHIHLGYYGKDQRSGPFYGGKDFIEAKYDFIDEMLKFSKVGMESKEMKILDVGCGIGGTSRYLAKKFPQAQVTGITLSPQQQRRGTQLAKERGIGNAEFRVCDALAMDYEDNTFDFVWACESGEHMPDKEKYVQEMTRVLKPGGRIVIATWCQREEPPAFSPKERKTLDYLYGEWTHPYFISIEEYARIMRRTGKLDDVVTDDWAEQTIPAWRHSIWVGVWSPWFVIRRPRLWWKVVRDGWCLEVMHRAFTKGLMQYGMMTAGKNSS